MKSALIHVLFLLFAIGVFGDADITETVSVIEGDSVTLHTGVTEIQRHDVIEWRLNGSRIAKISGDDSSTDGVFRDRLKLDTQTGDLMITNIRTTDSGEYKLEISTTRGSPVKTFSVSGVSGVDAEKSVSVIVGDSVTLNSGTIIQTDDVIEWRFLNSPIAEHNRKTGIFSTSDVPDGRFRHRLKLDHQTGSLTIRKTGTKHSGFYEAVIRKSSSKHTIHRSYSVTASGEMKSALSVKEGESVTLNSGLTEIQTDDLMLWMFEDTVLAEIIKAQKRFSIYDDVPDGRFRGRLKLDNQTGSLTITDTTTEDAGLYELQINIIRFTINKRITVTVGELKSALSVMKGESVTLETGLTEIQTVDLMLWRFEDTVLAEINKAHKRFSIYDDGPDGRFRDRLKLDEKTGSLTITDTTTEDAGLYELQINSIRFTINKRITVTVSDPGLSAGTVVGISVGVVLLAFAAAVAAVFYHRHRISELKARIDTLRVFEGESVTLNPDEVLQDDTLLWMFRGAHIAARESAALGFTVHDQIFKDRLKLDPQTGSLTIMNTIPADSGLYELQIIRSGKISVKRFFVSVFINIPEENNRNNPEENVPLTAVDVL